MMTPKIAFGPMRLTDEERMDRAGSEKPAGNRVAGVKNLQRTLASIGMGVKTTGVVDEATVEAVNSVFNGWDDAPESLKGGNLTASQIAKNLPTVSKYLRLAVHGAQGFGDASKD